MCGIAGYVGTREIGDEALEACLVALQHRGPNAQGAKRFRTPDGRHVNLLHVRLSIIDLDPRANQPFRTDSRWTTYNGEIYNYVELRADLEAGGERLHTASDTEVLARSLDRDGFAALDRMEGMWAFATYEEKAGELALSRDRFGEKPLYLYRDTTGIYFGSEPKAIFALLGRRLPPDHAHLARFLVNGYKALYKKPATFFEGVTELAPAALLRIGPNGESTTRYWAPSVVADDAMTYDDAVTATRERLVRSVEIRLRADVPLAFCMSGGVDSVSLISIARRVLGHEVHGFTIVNTDARYEEEEMVDHAASELGVRSTKIGISMEGFLPRLRELVGQHDGPVSTVTYYVQWLLMREIADAGYRISISGTAADELFSGYYDHHLAYLYDVRDRPDLAAAARAAWAEHVKPLVRNPFLSDPDLFVRNRDFRDHIYLNADEFAGYLTGPFSEGFSEEAYAGDLLRNRMLNELFHESVPVILHEDDLNAMSVSVENRSPFLDRGLFELAARIPTRHLVRDGRAKAVLRDAVRGIAPDRVLDSRRKVGFNAPIDGLLDRHDPAIRSELLDDSPVYDLVRREKIADLLDRPGELPNSESKLLFNFLGCKFFLEEAAA